MKGMTKFEGWMNRMGRTILSRGIELSEREMAYNGILGIINYEAIYEDGMSVDSQAMSIIMQARNTYPGGSVLVDSTVMGDGELHRVYSGIVFSDLYAQHMWILRRGDMYDGGSRAYGVSN